MTLPPAFIPSRVWRHGCAPHEPPAGRSGGILNLVLGALTVFLLSGCGGLSTPPGSMILTQTPEAQAGAPAGSDLLDARYPAGSRVVLAAPPFAPSNIRVLSEGLSAAGSPIVAPDGRTIFFTGKANAASGWQIYQTGPGGGRPKQVTSIAGGAMDPALIANDDLVFSSPIPKAGELWQGPNPPALYVQRRDGVPQRLTFGTMAAVEPTGLHEGRILFVSAMPAPNRATPPHLALFTINNDGTEVTAFSGQHDGPPVLHRPRELGDGRVAFVSADSEFAVSELWSEAVRTARPFTSRARLFSFPTSRCRSVEPVGDGTLLASFETRGLAGRSMRGSYAVFRVAPNAAHLGEPLFDDPARNDLEAVPLAPHSAPMGHISTMVPARKSGTILCLDAHRTTYRAGDGTEPARATRMRVLAELEPGRLEALGDVALQADGSFMAEVPADVPLSLQALDAQGQVLRRLPPTIWVRGGENRSCLGCHEPHNRSPRNLRPLAAFMPPVRLGWPTKALAQKEP